MAELAVEVDGSGHDMLEGTRGGVVVEFNKEHAIFGRALWDVEVRGSHEGDTRPHGVGLKIAEKGDRVGVLGGDPMVDDLVLEGELLD